MNSTIARIKNEDLLQQPPFTLFMEAINAPDTRDAYTWALKRFMAFLNVSDCRSLLTGSSKEIESRIISYLTDPNTKRLRRQSKKSNLAALSTFYSINDIVLNQKKIKRFIHPDTDIKEDRAYNKEEIQALLDKADHRLKVVILLMASSGLRIGAISQLRIKHFREIKEPPIYRITVYDGSEEKNYTFCNPECKKAVDAYLQYRKNMGEEIDGNSPLIRESISRLDQFKAKHPKTVTTASLEQAVYEIAIKAGLRKPTKLTQSTITGSIRHEVKITHGLRKFFITQLTNAKVDPARREYLVSTKYGKTNIDATEHMLIYDRPEQSDLLKDYASAIDLLTIDPTNRLQQKVNELETEKDNLVILERKLNKIMHVIAKMNYYAGELDEEIDTKTT